MLPQASCCMFYVLLHKICFRSIVKHLSSHGVMHARSCRTSACSLPWKLVELVCEAGFLEQLRITTQNVKALLVLVFDAKGNCTIGYLDMFHCNEICNFSLFLVLCSYFHELHYFNVCRSLNCAIQASSGSSSCNNI